MDRHYYLPLFCGYCSEEIKSEERTSPYQKYHKECAKIVNRENNRYSKQKYRRIAKLKRLYNKEANKVSAKERRKSPYNWVHLYDLQKLPSTKLERIVNSIIKGLYICYK